MPDLGSRELTVIQRFRESHHAVAEMFAIGMTPSMIRQKTGYSTRRLTLLWSDPTFQELIAIKSKRREEIVAEATDTFVTLWTGAMIKAARQLNDKLDEADDSGELLPTRELISVISDAADRFGYSKHSTVRVEHDFAAALDRAIAVPQQIEGTATEITPPLVLEHTQGPPTPPAPRPAPEHDQPASRVRGPLLLPRRRVA